MKIPGEINILSDIYTIQVEQGTFIGSNGGTAQGELLYDDKMIKIKKMSDSSMLKTFIHEVIHGICIDLNLYEGEPHNEGFIDRLATGLADTLIRNDLLKGD